MLGLVRRVKQALSPPQCEKSTTAPPLRFGILGAAAIAPPALIAPARSHPEVVVYAVAARSLERAERYAKKHGIEKVYGGEGSYQKLLDDPNVDAVYNPLPNGLHYEWTMKALQAGKHVLLEKPSADTAAETRAMFEFAQKKGLVLLEAFHYRFHPAVQRFKEIVASGEVGAIKHVEVALKVPRGLIGLDDIRYKLELGGGAMMDMGCYTVDCMRYIAGAEPTSVIAATADLAADARVDAGTTATLAFPGDVTGTLSCHLGMPPRFGFLPVFPQVHVRVECENGELSLFNFVMPTIYHSITVKAKSPGGKLVQKRVEKVYKPAKEGWTGEDWWTTYRYQLEAFVDAVRGRTPTTWLSAENAVADLEWIEKVYDKTGLGSRPASAFKLPEL